jgi:MYXO-CTERM domain-containing protein
MKPKHTLRHFLLIAGSSLLAVSSSHAGQIWDGGSSANNNWNTASNWDGATVNADGTGVLPSFGSAITFTGDVQISTNNDLTALSTVGGFNFTNDGSTGKTSAFTLAGNSVTIGNITTTANTAGSTITDVISLDLRLANNRSITTNQLSDTVQHNLSITGIISETGGNRGLRKLGAGVLTLSGENTFTGTMRVSAGTVRAGAAANGQAFGLNAPVQLDNTVGVTLDLNGYNQTIGSLTGLGANTAITLGSGILTVNQTTTTSHSGTITGTGGLIKTGAGQLTLSNSTGNTYNGATTVNEGTLVVTGSLVNSAVSVSNAGTVLATDAAASFGSTVAINTSAILAAGGNGAAGTATVGGTTTFNIGSTFSWDINSTGTTYDKLVAPSLAGGDAVFRIVVADSMFLNAFWGLDQTWTDIFTTDGSAAIADWAGLFNVSVVDSSFAALDTSSYGSFSISDSSLSWTVIPEPGAALLGSLGLLTLLRRRRNA